MQTARKFSFDEFVAQVNKSQEAYKAAKAAGDEEAMQEALAPLDETGTFWLVPLGTVYRADFTYKGKDAGDVVINLDVPTIEAMDGPSQQDTNNKNISSPVAFDQVLRPDVPDVEFQTDNANAIVLAEAAEAALAVYMKNGTFPRDKAYLAATTDDSAFIDTGAPFDQLSLQRSSLFPSKV